MDYIHIEFNVAAQCSQTMILFIYEALNYSANITVCKLDGKTNCDCFCSHFQKQLLSWQQDLGGNL